MVDPTRIRQGDGTGAVDPASARGNVDRALAAVNGAPSTGFLSPHWDAQTTHDRGVIVPAAREYRRNP
jgi:hypothetical protein